MKTKKILSLLLILLIPVVSFIFFMSLRFNNELVDFNNFPDDINKNVEIIEIEIKEALELTSFSRQALPIKKGWVSIGVMEGVVSTVDPSPRPSNPMNYLLFKFPGHEGIFSANELIQMPVEQGELRIYVNPAYFKTPVYTVVPKKNQFVPGKVKLAIHNHENYLNKGSRAIITDLTETSDRSGIISGQIHESNDNPLRATTDFFNFSDRLKLSLEESRAISEKHSEAKTENAIINSILENEDEYAQKIRQSGEKAIEETDSWLKRRINDLKQ